MGIDFVAFDESGKTHFCESVKWLRDDAPYELFYRNKHAMKEIMNTEDIGLYSKDIESYLNLMHFVAATPEERETYSEWVSDTEEKELSDWMYHRLREFCRLLQTCYETGLSARWSI